MEGEKWKRFDDPTEDNSDDDKYTMEFHLNVADPDQEVLELSTQFAAILAEVEISDEDFRRLNKLKEKILTIVNGRNPRITMATLFRHNYLKLRNAGSNQLLVYLSGSNYRPLFMQIYELESLFKNPQLKPLPGKSRSEVETGLPVMDIESGLIVGVATHADHQPEVVTCQLAKHLLDFDPRAKSLIILVHYWARLNDITLSEKRINIKQRTVSNIPDPAALEWLCLFFLGQEKVIPTLQKLRSQAIKRKDTVIIGRPEFNIGFPTDPGFIKEWRRSSMKSKKIPAQDSNDYVLEVLRLAHGFFSFFKNNLKGKVLNTVNGELLPLMAAIEEGLIVPSLNANNCEDKRSFELMRKKALALEAELAGEMYLMQPFHFQRFEIDQLKFDKKILPLMEMTRRKLKFYLECMHLKKEGTMLDGELKSLFHAGSREVELTYRIIKPVQRCPSPEEILTPTFVQNQIQNETSYSQDFHRPQLSIHSQYVAICKEVEIPDEEFLQILDLLGRILKTARKYNPRVQYTTIFRHNYLKLRNAGSNHILIYLSEFQHEPLNFIRPEREVERLFEGSIIRPLPVTSGTAKEKIEIGFPYIDKLTGLKFGVVTGRDYQVEVITCQLAKYLFKFDPRAKSLITLIHFWARENKVTLADPRNWSNPDPTALEWLCLFFLSREKLVPTLKELRNWAEKRRKTFFEGSKKLNIAFPNETHFIGEWKERRMKNIPPRGSDRYVIDLLKLVQRFFTFYSGKEWEGNVLRTEDGEVIPLISAIEEGLIEPSLDVNKCKDKTRFGIMRMKALKLEAELKGELYLMQPFLNKRFEVCQKKFENQVRPLMEKTGRGLQTFFERVEIGDRNGTLPEVDLRSLLEPAKRVEHFVYEKIHPELMQLNLGEKPEDNHLYYQASETSPKIWKEKDDDFYDSTLLSVSNNGDGASLLDHFKTLSEEVVMPDEEWEATTEFIRKLRDFFASNGFPNCELIPIRSRYLKLNPMDPEAIPVFFLDHPVLYSGDFGEPRRFSRPGRAYIEYQIWRVKENDYYSAETKQMLLATIEPLPYPAIGTQLKIPLLSFEHQSFHLATPSFLPEAQTCKMVKYLCTFDARVKLLMTFVFYWANLNNIRLGKDDQSQFIVGIAPDSSLLEWLVIFFLCEKKIVPPPSQISERNGGLVLLYEDVDIEVKTDQEYAREWWDRYKGDDEEKHALNVFLLAQEFFHFWNKLGLKAANEPVVIDLKNGRYFEKNEVFQNSDNTRRLSWATGISHHDLNLLNSEPRISQSFYSRHELVTIIHPLYLRYGFTFCWKSFLFTVCPKMGATSRKLNQLLKVYKTTKGNLKQLKTNCSMQTIFKV